MPPLRCEDLCFFEDGLPAAICRSAGALVVAIVLALTLGNSTGTGRADPPAADALARMRELSREAERTSEAIYSAELDLEAKLAAQRQAEDRQRAESEALTAARADLRMYQKIVDRVAAASTWEVRPAASAPSWPQSLRKACSTNSPSTA